MKYTSFISRNFLSKPLGGSLMNILRLNTGLIKNITSFLLGSTAIASAAYGLSKINKSD